MLPFLSCFRLASAGSPAALMLAFALVGYASACGESGVGVRPREQQLQHGIVAVAGEQPISAELVSGISRAQQVSLEGARDRAIRDALFAQAARDRLPLSQVRAVERSLIARSVLEEIFAEVRARGEPTEAELDEIVQERWFELDRPAASRTTHAVVLVKSAAEDARARAVADAIASAVRGAVDGADFKRRAQAVPPGALEVRIEELPFVTPDGRAFRQDAIRGAAAEKGKFNRSFAEAASAIERSGAVSPVVKTSFGYHVIYLEERLPERRLAGPERRAALESEVFGRRAARVQKELMNALQTSQPLAITRASDELMSSVPTRP